MPVRAERGRRGGLDARPLGDESGTGEGGQDGTEANAALAGEEPNEEDEPELADSVEALASTATAAQANDVDKRLEKIAAMESRGIEKRSQELRRELAEDLDADLNVVDSLGRREWQRETNLD